MFPMTSAPGERESAVMVVQAYRFALDPAPGQEGALRSHAGAARFAWNWALAACLERYAAERRWYSAAELHRRWNQVKKAEPALAWYHAGRVQAAQKQWAEARFSLAAALRLRPDLKEARALLAALGKDEQPRGRHGGDDR